AAAAPAIEPMTAETGRKPSPRPRNPAARNGPAWPAARLAAVRPAVTFRSSSMPATAPRPAPSQPPRAGTAPSRGLSEAPHVTPTRPSRDRSSSLGGSGRRTVAAGPQPSAAESARPARRRARGRGIMLGPPRPREKSKGRASGAPGENRRGSGGPCEARFPAGSVAEFALDPAALAAEGAPVLLDLLGVGEGEGHRPPDEGFAAPADGLPQDPHRARAVRAPVGVGEIGAVGGRRLAVLVAAGQRLGPQPELPRPDLADLEGEVSVDRIAEEGPGVLLEAPGGLDDLAGAVLPGGPIAGASAGLVERGRERLLVLEDDLLGLLRRVRVLAADEDDVAQAAEAAAPGDAAGDVLDLEELRPAAGPGPDPAEVVLVEPEG